MEHRDTEAWHQERHRLTVVLMASKPGEEQAKAFRDLQEWNAQDPMSRLGTSAAEASKAFQGLQEASKDLVDLEIVIPGPEASAANLLSGMGPRVPMVTEYGVHLLEVRPEQKDDIDQALRDLFREPWYKRVRDWLRGIGA